jgi:hypothetical protein
MGGGLLQLVAYGAQDVYLTGNPQITFFKVVYRRHTNFAIEAIPQTFNGSASYGNTVYCQISRNGDLINRTYLEVSLPALTTYSFTNKTTARYVNYVGLRLLKTITLEIGGQQIDKHYSDWLYIWNELSLPVGKRDGYRYMVGADSDVVSSGADGAFTKLYVPLEFWFCRNIGLALPLIALQYHEVKIKIEFDSRDNCAYKLSAETVTATTLAVSNATDLAILNKPLECTIWVDYIFLDTDERRRFAQLSHEYLIEQLQFTGQEILTSGANRIKLNFNHPCKELIWVAKTDNSDNVNHWYNYTYSIDGSGGIPYGGEEFSYPSQLSGFSYGVGSTDGAHDAYTSNLNLLIEPKTGNPFKTALLQLNGNDRFDVRTGGYFNYVQPYQHHNNIPENQGINVYSFALKPEEHQPSGTLNMSRIDTAVLSVNSSFTATKNINIYAVNYNVLRILSGMGGLAYSN